MQCSVTVSVAFGIASETLTPLHGRTATSSREPSLSGRMMEREKSSPRMSAHVAHRKWH